jgi:hypothetical protein
LGQQAARTTVAINAKANSIRVRIFFSPPRISSILMKSLVYLVLHYLIILGLDKHLLPKISSIIFQNFAKSNYHMYLC